MKARPAIVYSILRILAFLVPFGILMLFPVFQDLYWLAAIFAALIGLSLSLLLLRRPLADATAGLGQPRAPRRVAGAEDAEAEDAVADDAAGTTPTAPDAAGTTPADAGAAPDATR
ncbi:DUF4229 domain-containing protein [Microbacterium sp. cx-55]|uniref:DUF4229 domain-containing protein n=1 Tax=unclassified Microbacterium TaxID=2609290 RepID=UPI001CC09BDB|nr:MULTISPECIES: DUF4229 domain-containing protein [unclassified Microbacterium]MBZ4487862.1 DUF4229 domain-containing protein [Microbacterium sp. cx-55]MCC4909111.1 DUF4229 domain-containing protein [Microbacterium sp. cx-59]UGB34727.1 DUF4229 domain-containing protein [Microbacterium sp. cx-55]